MTRDSEHYFLLIMRRIKVVMGIIAGFEVVVNHIIVCKSSIFTEGTEIFC